MAAGTVPPVLQLSGDILRAEINRDNASYYEALAAEEIRAGRVGDGLYFMEAADFYAEPSPQVTEARTRLLLEAMGQMDERTAGQ
jgi:hypothetical protein